MSSFFEKILTIFLLVSNRMVLHTLLVGQPPYDIWFFCGKGWDMMGKKISVIGGDLRQIYAAKYFREQGYTVSVFRFDSPCPLELSECFDLADTDCVLLPLPVTRDGVLLNTPLWNCELTLEELFSKIPKETTVFCGMAKKLPVCFQDLVTDYADDEGFLLKNAYLTAEAALELAIARTPISLFGASVLVTGYGRIGCFLAKMLHSLGAVTYVASRSPAHLTKIELEGCIPVSYDTLSDVLPKMDMIFNTVPFVVFTKELLKQVPKESLFVDLASLPGGVDKDAAKLLGVEVNHALSLPGKVAPVSSGKIVADTVIRLLSDKNRQ